MATIAPRRGRSVAQILSIAVNCAYSFKFSHISGQSRVSILFFAYSDTALRFFAKKEIYLKCQKRLIALKNAIVYDIMLAKENIWQI